MRWIVPLLCAGISACANTGFPRGAPLDTIPPRVGTTIPEDGAVNADLKEVEFVFMEVVGERPQSTPTLAGLFLISPSAGEPRVVWRRRALAVRPKDGWLPNTTYTITMLPGVIDLQNNVGKEGATVVFSTGAVIDSSRIGGILFDWVAEQPAARAIVRARLVPQGAAAEQPARRDTAVYSAVTDSTGRFTLMNLPDGVYEIRGFIDGNGNRLRDAFEAFDSTSVTVNDSARVELLAFVHDTNPPRMLAPAVRDSFTFSVQFSRPLDPSQILDATVFELISATTDSAVIPIVLVRPERANERAMSPADSLRADSVARADSIRGAQRPAPPPAPRQAVMPSRPKPPQTLLFQVGTPLAAGRTYLLRMAPLRGLLGTSAAQTISFTMRARTGPEPGKESLSFAQRVAIPAPAGIQCLSPTTLDSRLRGNDDFFMCRTESSIRRRE